MATHVYANGREIAAQAADGIASPAFPDPCWSPPPPPAGPVVIPYSNTARPRSLKNGSYSVFIGGQPVALEDSYFATSTGDEPATPGLSKGVMSGTIKGKAYFRSWSMNVRIEGKGVARHLDRMTHNHGSYPGNTPPFPYISRAAGEKHDCSDEEDRIKTACEPNDKWRDHHCAGLQPKKGLAKDTNSRKAAFERMQAELAGLEQLLPQLGNRAGENYQSLLARAQVHAGAVCARQKRRGVR